MYYVKYLISANENSSIEKGRTVEGISTKLFIFDSLTKSHTRHLKIKWLNIAHLF